MAYHAIAQLDQDDIFLANMLNNLDNIISLLSASTDGDPATRLPVLVTASVDRIMLSKPVNLNTAVHMQGKVAWTGRSSLDIRMEISQVSRSCSFTHYGNSLLPCMALL